MITLALSASRAQRTSVPSRRAVRLPATTTAARRVRTSNGANPVSRSGAGIRQAAPRRSRVGTLHNVDRADRRSHEYQTA